jgi:hypothetical protein
MAPKAASQSAEGCRFLFPVMADRLWLQPGSAYCRRPDGRVRVPAATTVACICLTAAHLLCPGYLASLGPDATGAGRPAQPSAPGR